MLLCSTDFDPAQEQVYINMARQKFHSVASGRGSKPGKSTGERSFLAHHSSTGEDYPYARVISAFGAFGNVSACMEFTCIEEFSGDLRELFLVFLECCSYPSQ